MREIKFRAWLPHEKKMEYHEFVMFPDEGKYREFGDDNCSVMPEPIIMQFTGMYDNTKWEDLTENEKKEWLNGDSAYSEKNIKENWKGKRIYENDIIKTESLFNDHNQKGAIRITTVKFWQSGFHLCGQGCECGVDLFSIMVCSKIWVIGNIYENPELLEGGKNE